MRNPFAKIKIDSLLIFNGAFVACALIAVAVMAVINTQGSERIFGIVISLFALLSVALSTWWLHRNLVAQLREAVTVGKQISTGDLTGKFANEAAGEIGEMRQALLDTSQNLFNLVREVRNSSVAIETISRRVTNDNTALATRNETQASSLEETSASLEQLTATVNQNTENSVRANSLVGAASAQASKGGQEVERVVATMESIKQSSHKIVDIISVIDGIAFQTNILALNAAVEAARAGEQGRGFAVVAAEVRSLAQRSAEAAKEIKTLISDSVNKVDSGSKLVNDAGKTMGEVVKSIQEVASLMRGLATASQEQSAGISQVNTAVAQFDGILQENSALVDGALKSAASLNESALALAQSVEHFNLGSEVGNAEEVQALVQQALDLAQKQGLPALVQEVKKLNKSQLLNKDLYIAIYDMNGVVLAHGTNRHFDGAEAINIKDPDGKPYVRDMIATVDSKDSGWVRYKFAHPVTADIRQKSVFVARFEDAILTCGCYVE